MIRGFQHFRIAWGYAVWAWLLGVLLRAQLYARPTPYGDVLVRHWDRYFFHAVFYSLVGVFIVALPFLLTWLIVRQRSISWTRARWAHRGLGLLLITNLYLDHFDHQVFRFMGVHATRAFLATYGRLDSSDTVTWSVAHDAGGMWATMLPFAWLPLGFIGFAWIWSRRVRTEVPRPTPTRWRLGLIAGLVMLPLAMPLLMRALPGGTFRMRKVQPCVMTLYAELRADAQNGERPPDLDGLIKGYQSQWLDESGAAGEWAFKTAARPLLRTPTTRVVPPDEGRWNVIYIQFETLRGMEAGHLRPTLSPSPTPVLDRLARSSAGAYWPNFASFGPPTVSGFMAGHSSVRPHSRNHITTQFNYIQLYALPQMLREHGYTTEFITASDPDWDGQAIWLSRWFDQTHFYRDAHEDDAVAFDRATERIKALGRAGPFMVSIATISNHYPFRSRDAASDIAGTEVITDCIKNTTHYTDHHIGKMLAALADEPFFKRTLVVVTGDHAYNLGEHDTAGQRNGHVESWWVPLIIAGDHPRLVRGQRPAVGSLLDIAPTIADLLGFRVANPWQGHSLVTAAADRAFVVHNHRLTFGRTLGYTFMQDRKT